MKNHLLQKLSGVWTVLRGDRGSVAHLSWPIHRRLREKLMSLLQPHSSPDKAADYTTCSGKRIVCVSARICTCVYVCVRLCVSPDPEQSSANRTFTSQERTFFDKHTFAHQLPLSRRNLSLSHSLAYMHQLSRTRDHVSLTHTHTHSIKCD